MIPYVVICQGANSICGSIDSGFLWKRYLSYGLFGHPFTLLLHEFPPNDLSQTSDKSCHNRTIYISSDAIKR